MATEYLTVRHTAGKTVYFRVFDPSQGAGANLYTWDFDDDQWETSLAGATTPKLSATEKTDAGDGQDSTYVASYDFSNINSTTTPKEILIQTVDDLTTDEIIGEWTCYVVSGAIVQRAGLSSIDGVDSALALKAMLAAVLGKAAPSGSNVVFKDRAGNTLVTVTVGSSAGERTGSVIAGE